MFGAVGLSLCYVWCCRIISVMFDDAVGLSPSYV